MKHLLDKDALVEEIESLFELWQLSKNNDGQAFMESVRSFIDSFEVKDVDLEEALSKLDEDIKEFVTTEEFEKESKTCGHYWAIAKHAFLLGLKAQKGE